MDKRYSPDRYKHYSTMKFEEKELKKIKVEIKRKIPTVECPSQELDHSVDKLDEIKIYRSAGEGSRPIFSRQDIIVNREDTEHRTVSAHSPQRSSPVRNRSSSRSPRRYSHKSEYPRRQQNDPGSSNSNNHERSRNDRGSPYRIASSSSRHQRDNNSPRRNTRRDRSRSKSNETNRRTRRSRTRSPRRHGTRSPDRESRRRERNEYHRSERDRNSRSPRYTRRSSSRSRSTRVDSTVNNKPPVDNFHMPENALWISPPLCPSMMVPPGMMPPRGGPYGMYGVRPPLPRIPYQHMQLQNIKNEALLRKLERQITTLVNNAQK